MLRCLGRGGHLDSLGLVNLILFVEERVFTEFGIEITLSDDRAMSQKKRPVSERPDLDGVWSARSWKKIRRKPRRGEVYGRRRHHPLYHRLGF